LLGLISDRLGRRKPVIIGGGVVLLVTFAWILFGRADVFPPYILGIVAGTASGAAMLPYTVIKEANPPEASGTATGVVNFLNFTFSALLTPVFGWVLVNVAGGIPQLQLEHYQTAFAPLLVGVALAILLTFFLKETGPARTPRPAAARGPHGANDWNRQVRSTAGQVPQP
jgi:MFS family permease